MGDSGGKFCDKSQYFYNFAKVRRIAISRNILTPLQGKAYPQKNIRRIKETV